MKRGRGRVDEKILRLCRNINQRVDNRKELQSLAARLQEVLREESCRTQVVKAAMQPDEDDPFDKIMVA